MKSRGNMPRRQPKTTPKALPRLLATRQLQKKLFFNGCTQDKNASTWSFPAALKRGLEGLLQAFLPKILHTLEINNVATQILSTVITCRTIESFTKHYQCPSCLRVCFLMPLLPENWFISDHCQWWPKVLSIRSHHGGNAKLSSKSKVNVLPGNNHDEVVEEAEADEGKGVVIRQLF